MKCSQTGTQNKAKVSQLSTGDGEALTIDHLTKGSKLMLRYKGKDYDRSIQRYVNRGGM